MNEPTRPKATDSLIAIAVVGGVLVVGLGLGIPHVYALAPGLGQAGVAWGTWVGTFLWLVLLLAASAGVGFFLSATWRATSRLRPAFASYIFILLSFASLYYVLAAHYDFVVAAHECNKGTAALSCRADSIGRAFHGLPCVWACGRDRGYLVVGLQPERELDMLIDVLYFSTKTMATVGHIEAAARLPKIVGMIQVLLEVLLVTFLIQDRFFPSPGRRERAG